MYSKVKVDWHKLYIFWVYSEKLPKIEYDISIYLFCTHLSSNIYHLVTFLLIIYLSTYFYLPFYMKFYVFHKFELEYFDVNIQLINLQRVRMLDGITDSLDMSLSKLRLVMDTKAGCAAFQEVETVKQNWVTELTDCGSVVKSSPAMQET